METYWTLLAAWVFGMFVTVNLIYDVFDPYDDQIAAMFAMLIVSALWPLLVLLILPLATIRIATYPARLWRRRRGKVSSKTDR